MLSVVLKIVCVLQVCSVFACVYRFNAGHEKCDEQKRIK
jgi:hypothetical protein